jgi:hypothetical protein
MPVGVLPVRRSPGVTHTTLPVGEFLSGVRSAAPFSPLPAAGAAAPPVMSLTPHQLDVLAGLGRVRETRALASDRVPSPVPLAWLPSAPRLSARQSRALGAPAAASAASATPVVSSTQRDARAPDGASVTRGGPRPVDPAVEEWPFEDVGDVDDVPPSARHESYYDVLEALGPPGAARAAGTAAVTVVPGARVVDVPRLVTRNWEPAALRAFLKDVVALAFAREQVPAWRAARLGADSGFRGIHLFNQCVDVRSMLAEEQLRALHVMCFRQHSATQFSSLSSHVSSLSSHELIQAIRSLSIREGPMSLSLGREPMLSVAKIQRAVREHVVFIGRKDEELPVTYDSRVMAFITSFDGMLTDKQWRDRLNVGGSSHYRMPDVVDALVDQLFPLAFRHEVSSFKPGKRHERTFDWLLDRLLSRDMALTFEVVHRVVSSDERHGGTGDANEVEFHGEPEVAASVDEVEPVCARDDVDSSDASSESQDDGAPHQDSVGDEYYGVGAVDALGDDDDAQLASDYGPRVASFYPSVSGGYARGSAARRAAPGQCALCFGIGHKVATCPSVDFTAEETRKRSKIAEVRANAAAARAARGDGFARDGFEYGHGDGDGDGGASVALLVFAEPVSVSASPEAARSQRGVDAHFRFPATGSEAPLVLPVMLDSGAMGTAFVSQKLAGRVLAWCQRH